MLAIGQQLLMVIVLIDVSNWINFSLITFLGYSSILYLGT